MSANHIPAIPWEAPDKPILLSNEVHVWRSMQDHLRQQFEDFYRLLSTDEKERAHKFYFKKDGEHFIVSRGLLRRILGLYLERDPKQLRFCYSSYGKPFLEESLGGSLRFNLTHSQGIVLLAVTSDREVGIDVERIRSQVINESIAERFFSAHEVETLRALPFQQQAEAFFNCWTRKEAYIKARGEGLSCPLYSFDVSLKPGEPAALLATRVGPHEMTRWRFVELCPGVNFKAALVAERPDWQPKCWQWSC
jgi:4'-phosphopantetheinyl transferase